MAAEEKTAAARGTLATVVATASVTLAIGITVAALGGYLAPPSNDGDTAAVQPSEQTAVKAPPATPDVVLVPIAPNGGGAPSMMGPLAQAPEVLTANYETGGYQGEEEEEDDEGDGHGRRGGGDHDEDEDDDD